MNPEQWLSLKWNGGSTMSDRWLNQSKIIQPYEYFEHLLTEIPKHMEDTDRSFLDDLLPWSEKLPKEIKKTNKRS